MATIISIALQKGGVGKSTTAQALANTLGFKGRKTLLIDLDSQANTTFASGAAVKLTIFDVFNEECSTSQAIVSTKYYDLLAADERLTMIEKFETKADLLRNALAAVQANYDYVIIDTPPALGILLANALTASDYVIIPTEAKPFAIQGIVALSKTIQNVQERFNSRLKVMGILLIKHKVRSVLGNDLKAVVDKLAADMNTVVFDRTIREGIAVAEAQTVRKPLIDYAKSSNPNIDYKGFTTELLKMIGDIRDGETC